MPDYQRLLLRYNKLHARHQALKKEHAGCAEYMKAAYDKYKAARDNAISWQKWVDKHRDIIDTHREEVSKSSTLSERRNDNEGEEITRASRHVTSSQTTEDDQAGSSPPWCEVVTDDVPEVISARPVKRKRSASIHAMPPPPRVKQEPNSPDNPIELGSDHYSSPELKRTKPVRTETSDLDAIMAHIDTPGRRKRRRAASEEAVQPPRMQHRTSSLSDGDASDFIVPPTQVKTEAADAGRTLDPLVITRDFALLPDSEATDNTALRQLSINVPASPRKSNVKSNMGRKRRRQEDDARVKVAFLSEDGDYQTSQVDSPKRKHAPSSHAQHRLDTLLEVPSPKPELLPKRRTPDAPPRQFDHTPQGSKPQPKTIRSAPAKAVTQFQRPRGLEKSPPPAQPHHEPLRSRTLDKVRLEDFVVNPSYAGSNFAFADTIRGRAQKRCLQGCTRPGCCGNAFRKAIEVGAIRTTKTDTQVLEEYLGPNWEEVMGHYSKDKRGDLLMQARAQSLANQHGKHRQAFERRSTPPGFWRTDMPTTQEEKEDRSRAQELERQKVEERWREALRPGRTVALQGRSRQVGRGQLELALPLTPSLRE